MIQSVLMEAAGVQGRRTARNVSRGAEFHWPSSPLTLAFVFPLKTPKALLILRSDVSSYVNDSLVNLPVCS